MKIGRFLLIPLFLIALFIIFGDKGLIDYCKLEEKLSSIREVNGLIVNENKALKEEIMLLRNDSRYIEMVARRELGMVEHKDIVYQFVD
ncbi:MAG: septum formation initiator family protein [Thermodesulfobacteriota bacterium]|nr:septum formation initiator family protein [Thermodesulfobacteriota bacterium]